MMSARSKLDPPCGRSLARRALVWTPPRCYALAPRAVIAICVHCPRSLFEDPPRAHITLRSSVLGHPLRVTTMVCTHALPPAHRLSEPAQAVPSEERRARNRQAAKASRERQRAEMAALQLRVAELEAENARIRAGPSTPATGSEPAAASLVPWVESASFMERPPWYDSPTLTHTGAMYLPPTPVTRNESFSSSSDSVSHEPELRPIRISPPRVSVRLPRPAMSTDAWFLHEERRKSGPRFVCFVQLRATC
jgi:hypothetical protein